MNVSIRSYNNGRSNATYVDIGLLRLYFSYQTVVAFRVVGQEVVCIQNYWQQTTGKHLNLIEPDHSLRLNSDDFGKALARINITVAVEELATS